MTESGYTPQDDAEAPWENARRPDGMLTWFRMDPRKPDAHREIGARIAGMVEWLMTYDRARTDRYERYFQLYGGTRLIGIRPWENPTVATAAMMTNRVIEDSLRLNVCKAAVDTVTSKVGKLRPRPTFVTDHGDFDLQQRAKQLQIFMDGAYHQSDAWEHGASIFRDAMVFGTGVLHAYGECRGGVGRVCSERVPVWELYVDPADAIYNTPRCLYRVKWVSRDQAQAQWPGVTLLGPTATSQEATATEAYRQGYVRVIEAWARAMPGSGESGAHALVVGGELVLDDPEDFEWCYEEFPFCFVHWTKPIQGFWGDSAIREVVGIQVEINKLIQSIQASMQLVGVPWVLRKEGVILRPDKVQNIPGQVVTVEASTTLDEAIRVVTFQPVHPQVVSHVWQLYAKAFEILGSNQLAASATAPPGLESGRALETLAEEHSERFMTVSRHFEYVMGEALARQFIRVAKELDEELREHGVAGGFAVRAPGAKRSSVKLRWDEVAIDEDGFIIQVWPESVLPTTPAARIQHVQSLADAGWVDRTEARRLLNMPDLTAEDDLATADEDNLHRQLNDMLAHGVPIMPEPYQNLNRALTLAQQAVLRAQADGVAEARIDLVRDFIAAVEALLQRAQAASAPPAPGVPGAVDETIARVNQPAMAGAPEAPPPGMPPG